MCGRYRLGRGREAFRKYFGVDREGYDWSPRFNIAPTQQVPVIRQNRKEPKRELSFMRWGLIPNWSKDPSGPPMINARSETAFEKPAFRDALTSRRCLVPADGFYEWKRDAKSKQPYCFTLQDESVFAFAGLWDLWISANGESVETCSVLTTTPNKVARDIHDRMPVILPTAAYDLWLDPAFTSTEGVQEMLHPYAAGEMKKFPVSTRVNNANNDDQECSALVELPAQGRQSTLF